MFAMLHHSTKLERICCLVIGTVSHHSMASTCICYYSTVTCEQSQYANMYRNTSCNWVYGGSEQGCSADPPPPPPYPWGPCAQGPSTHYCHAMTATSFQPWKEVKDKKDGGGGEGGGGGSWGHSTHGTMIKSPFGLYNSASSSCCHVW